MQHALPFLEAVLPSGGLRVVAHRPPTWKGGFKHDFYESNEEVVLRTRQINESGRDAWFGLASFATNTSREATNTVALQTLWIDLDYKQYESVEEAHDALARLYTVVGYPSIRVQSGGGLHAYWVLRHALPTAEWKPLALAFQATWQSLGIRADPVSADAARVLRLPGSLNHKYDPPREVTIETFDDLSYDPERLASKLAQAPKSTAAAIPAGVAVPASLQDTNDDLTAGLNERPVFIKPIVRQCRQMQWAFKNQAQCTEPIWYAVLQLVRFVDNGRRVAHIFSNQHPEYDVEATDAKLAQLERQDIGPTTCERFRQVNPQGCAGCPLSIKSPIVLGFEAPEPVTPVITVKELHYGDDGEVSVVEREEKLNDGMPPSYSYDGTTIYRKAKNPEGLEVIQPIYRGFIAVERLMTNPRQNYATEIQVLVRPEGQHDRRIFLPGKSFADKRALAQDLSSKGVIALSKNAAHILDLLQQMTQQVQARKLDATIADQFGWQEDGSFVVGTTAFMPDGSQQPDVPLAPALKQVASHFVPRGTLARWKELAEIYNRPGGEAYQFALCYGAAGIFLNQLQLSGVVLSLMSQQTGRGKSTAGEAALSWWGNPTLMKSNATDTVNSLFNKAGRHKNLPLLFDEVTTRSPWELEDIVYFMTQGREKERLTSDGTPRPVLPGWALPVISTSNNSIRTKLQGQRGDAQALFARIIEVSMDLPFAETMGFADREALKTGFKDNFGHAGPYLMKTVLAHPGQWKQIMDSLAAKLDTALQGDSGYRFWVASCAATLTVAFIARRIGLLNYDVTRLSQWAIDTLKSQRLQNKSSLATSADILAQFLEQNANRILVSYLRNVGSSASVPAIWPEDGVHGNQLVGRVELPERSLYISQAAFMRFCNDNGFDMSAFTRTASTEADPISGELLLKNAMPVQVNLGRGTRIASGRTQALQFNLLHPSLREYANGIDSQIGEVTHLRSVK